MILTLRQRGNYKSSLWAAAVPGLLLSLSNRSSAGSLLASSLQGSFTAHVSAVHGLQLCAWPLPCVPP